MRRRIFIASFLTLLLAGCAKNPATPATPPQVTTATTINVLAQSLDAAVSAIQAAHTAGKISDQDYLLANGVSQVIAQTGKSINAELRSSDPWATQQTKIVQIITQAGVTAAMAKLSPTAQGILAASLLAFNQISSAVGGPKI